MELPGDLVWCHAVTDPSPGYPRSPGQIFDLTQLPQKIVRNTEIHKGEIRPREVNPQKLSKAGTSQSLTLQF